MNKNFNKEIIIYSCVLLAVMVTIRASVINIIFPFGVAFLFAMNEIKINKFFLLICYFLCSMIFNPSITNLIETLFSCVGVLLVVLVCKITKKQMPTYLIGLIMLISQCAFIYFNLETNRMFVTSITSVFLSYISFYIFTIAVKALYFRVKVMRFSVDEKICIAYLLVIIFSGLSQIIVLNFNMTNMICITILFVLSRVLTKQNIMIVAVLAGVGIGLTTLSVVPIAIFSSWGVLMLLFQNNKKIVAALMVFAGDAIIGGVLNAYGEYGLITFMPQISGLLLVSCIPDKLLFNWFYWIASPHDILEKYMIQRSEKNIKQQLDGVSKIFLDMQNIYRTFLLAPVDKKIAEMFIAEETRRAECDKCSKYKTCYGQNNEIKSEFETLAHIATEKGNVCIIDVPAGIASGCDRVQSVVGKINCYASGIKTFGAEAEQKNKNTMEIAMHLGETGKIISNLASKYSKEVSFDYDMAQDIYDELVENNIKVCDVVCEKRNSMPNAVVIAIAREDVANPIVLQVAQKVLKLKTMIESVENSSEYGYVVLTLKPCGNFEFSYGVATLAKATSGESGDNFAINKITNTKYLYAIADGMGNGKQANKLSTATISLVENYYKVGFNADLIIDEVNKIMIPTGQDNFVTIDSAVIDAENGRCDFMKLGASVSIIKRKGEQQLIEGKSLPVGIVENVCPTFTTRYLEDGDVVILSSDGVVDAFSGVDRYYNYVASLSISSPQLLADTILEEAEAITKGIKDDMTIFVIKAFLK